MTLCVRKLICDALLNRITLDKLSYYNYNLNGKETHLPRLSIIFFINKTRVPFSSNKILRVLPKISSNILFLFPKVISPKHFPKRFCFFLFLLKVEKLSFLDKAETNSTISHKYCRIS